MTTAGEVFLKSAVDGQEIPLWVRPDRALALKRESGAAGRKALVISVPKSGTYLVAKILAELGLVDLEIHISAHVFSDYRFKTIRDKVEKARLYSRRLPLEVVASLIHEGQFAVGHLFYEWQTVEATQGFAKIVTVREARDALVSMMHFERRRMLADAARDTSRRAWIEVEDPRARMVGFLAAFGKELTGTFREIAPWRQANDTLVVRFEDLQGDHGSDAQNETVRKIAAFVDVRGDFDPADILRRSLGSETLTFSGQRSRHDEVWSDQAETMFEQFGGGAVNIALGYSAQGT